MSSKGSKKTKKGNRKIVFKIKFASISLAILVTTAIVLLELPSAVSLAQGKLFTKSFFVSAGEETSLNAQVSQVAGVEKNPSIEIKNIGIDPPTFSAKSVLAEDLDSGQMLYQKDIHKRLLPASTTKLMTALVAVDHYKMTDILQVSEEDLVGGSVMGLSAGEKLSFRSLLYGMLLNSGNDAAFTLASNFPGGVDSFVDAMNQKAKSLGLSDTHFQNPAGFDDPGQYSTTYDLSIIANQISQNPELINITSTKDTTVFSSDSAKEHSLHNLNKLLGEVGVIGIKTGFTQEAGENLVGLVERERHRILTVVLDSTDRFGETKSLMDWAFKNFTWNVASH